MGMLNRILTKWNVGLMWSLRIQGKGARSPNTEFTRTKGSTLNYPGSVRHRRCNKYIRMETKPRV
jgi:hypothetical protein